MEYSERYFDSSIIHHYGSNVYKSDGAVSKPETRLSYLPEENYENSRIRNKRKIVNEFDPLTGPTRWKNKIVPYKIDDKMRKYGREKMNYFRLF